MPNQPNNSTIVSTPQGVQFAQLCAFIGAVSLESKGLRHSSGVSMTKRAKQMYGLTGNAAKVLAALCDLREKAIVEAKERASGS